MKCSASLMRLMLLLALFGSGAATFSGCATYADRLSEVRDVFATGNLQVAEESIEKGMRRRCDPSALKAKAVIGPTPSTV